MNLKIKRMVLDSFKGIKHKELEFTDVNDITGENGAGKTTIATAYHWVFANTDYDLKSNPNIYPLGVEEATPSVEIEMTIDDKPVRIRKTQTRKVSESNGTRKVALTNTYSVNEVPMSERDMQSKLSDMGFDFEKFSTLTNPNAFLAEKKDTQRKILFSMATNYSDYQVATMLENVNEAAVLLKDYSVDEVKAIQNATLKKITENYGKKGEILNAKIEGLSLSKVDLDFSALEIQRNMLKEQLEKNRDAQEVGNSIERELNDLRSQNMTWQFKVSDLSSQLEQERKAREEKLSANKRAAQEKAVILDNDIRRYTNEVDIHGNSIKRLTAEIEASEAKISEVETEVLDEDSLYCSLCGQLLQFEKREDVRRNFEANKLKRIADLHTKIDESRSLLAIKRTEMAEITRKIEKATDDRKALETALNEHIFAPQGASEESQRILGELNKAKAQLEAVNSLIETKQAGMPNMSVLKGEELTLHNDLRNCEIQLSKADTNNEIDEKITELRELQMKYEQDRANAERILYQLDEIQKKKNELLTDEINKNFSIVKFVFFTYLKNGSYTETCIATIDGKELGSSTNTGLEIRAKLDIINGLQNFFNQHYLVILDQAESLSETSVKQIKMDCQMVFLKVTEDKELKIE